ncbi:hypothetical protein EOG37_01140 [Clavibacter michiganensis subsp. michiganensis]|uniref:hypothetical protein n=1 Tax=Clavibacter michiganensis TaxID=28447 RepID=UPI001C654448|nr:hypothetical protein [Clavibacter michiganensis]MBW8025287.1 hypothetical protein [Clavibacter michiganensis subsp. michiganensis]
MQLTTLGITKSIGPKEWATYMGHLAGDPTVGDPASFAATATEGSRVVTVAPGSAAAYGHDVIGTGTESMTFPRPTSGGQWHALVLERVSATNLPGSPVTARLVLLPGPTTQDADEMYALLPEVNPTGWTVQPGVKTHQLLYWGWVGASGSFSRLGVALRDMRRMHARTIPVTNDQQDFRSGYFDGLGIIATGATLAIFEFEFTTLRPERVVGTAYGMWGVREGGPFSGGPAAGNLWMELNGDRIGYTAWDKIEAKDARRPFTVQGRGTTRVGSNLLQLVGSTNFDSAYRDFVQVRMEAMPA